MKRKNIMLGCVAGWMIIWMFGVLVMRVFAGEADVFTGVEGQTLVAAQANPTDSKVVLVGATDGLFVTRDIAAGEFERVKGFPKEKCSVVELALDGPVVYVSTERGVFVVEWRTLEARSIFDRSDAFQRSVASVRQLGSSLFVASRGGVFVGETDGKSWIKTQGPWQGDGVVFLEVTGNNLFAATGTGVFKTSDNGRTWGMVFDVGSGPEEPEIQEADVVETGSSPKILSMISGSSVLFVATSSGVKQTMDDGATWQDVPSAGCDVVSMRRLYFDDLTQRLYALTGSGVYALKADGWVRCMSTGFARDIFRRGERISVLTERGIRDVGVVSEAGVPQAPESAIQPFTADHFVSEPTVQEVQDMAIAYAEVSNNKIKDWRRRANVKALMPTFGMNYSKTIYGSSSGAIAVGPMDWGMTMSWDLGDLIYNSDQTSIDTRSKLMVELRNDILAEVTRLYFERRKLQIELMDLGNVPLKSDKELKIQETTALIDRLTGGHYSRVLKSMSAPRPNQA